MEVGSSAGSQAVVQLMEANNSLRSVTTQQLQAVNNSLEQVKAGALQHTAQNTAAEVERKQNAIDLMA